MASRFGIVVIEDNAILLDITVEALRSAGHDVRGLAAAEEFDEQADALVDIIIIDLNLPGEDGLQFARRIRKSQPRIGIIMVTARTLPAERIAGYRHGADIYLTKPTSMEELLSAVQALGMRLAPSGIDPSQPRLDQRKLRVDYDNKSVALTDPEARILTALARAAGQRLEKWQLLEIAGSDDFSKGALEVRIARLRKKLEQIGLPDPSIRAIRNFGYQLCIQLQLI
jgi:DNA-binding response OmpR family regulator